MLCCTASPDVPFAPGKQGLKVQAGPRIVSPMWPSVAGYIRQGAVWSTGPLTNARYLHISPSNSRPRNYEREENMEGCSRGRAGLRGRQVHENSSGNGRGRSQQTMLTQHPKTTLASIKDQHLIENADVTPSSFEEWATALLCT